MMGTEDAQNMYSFMTK